MEKQQDRWENARDVIKHEDELVHYRQTAFLTTQGFLFAGLTLGIGALSSDKAIEFRPLMFVVMLLISVVGMLTPYSAATSVRLAFYQLRATGLWWKEYGSLSDIDWADLPKDHKFPPVKGSTRGLADFTKYNFPIEVMNRKIGPGTFWLYHVMGAIWIAIFLAVAVYTAAFFTGHHLVPTKALVAFASNR